MNQIKFVVIEGVDGAGKESIINELLQMLKKRNIEFYFKKNFDSQIFDNFNFFRIFLILLKLFWRNLFITIPSKIKGKIVIISGSYFTLQSFQQNKKLWYNKWLISIFSFLITKPQAFVYITTDLKQRLIQLKQNSANEYQKQILKDPEQILQRESLYYEIYNRFSNKKIFIDSTEESIEECAKEIFIYLFIERFAE
jgi:thymidylate kinase